jgi:hypothetical protein
MLQAQLAALWGELTEAQAGRPPMADLELVEK